jgi:hypothetical protein
MNMACWIVMYCLCSLFCHVGVPFLFLFHCHYKYLALLVLFHFALMFELILDNRTLQLACMY